MESSDRVFRNLDFEAQVVRLRQIVHLDAMLSDGSFCDDLRAVIGPDFSELRQALIDAGLKFPIIATAKTVEELEVPLSDLAGKFRLGFLVKAQQPYFIIGRTESVGDVAMTHGIQTLRESSTEVEGELQYSWELSRARWFFARTYEAGLAAVHDWAACNLEEARIRARTAAGITPQQS
jgi:hypothetical protein